MQIDEGDPDFAELFSCLEETRKANWATFYRHLITGDLWSVTYPSGGVRGGGPRRLIRLDIPTPGDWVAHPDKYEMVAARVVVRDTAQSMLEGRLPYIQGAWKMNEAWRATQLDEWDADFIPFVGICSETDALPIGEQRQYWARDALTALQPEIDRKEAWAKRVGEPACRRLVARPQLSYRMVNDDRGEGRRFRIVLRWDGVPSDTGRQAAQDIANGFAHRPWHHFVSCKWDGACHSITLEASNEFDADGRALLDEFSDEITNCVKDAGDGAIHIISVTRIQESEVGRQLNLTSAHDRFDK